MIYTLTLNPSIDCNLYVSNLELGKINRSVTEEMKAGGKGINVSKMLKALNVPSTAIAVTAGASGHYFEELFAKEHIAYNFVHMDSGETRTNIKIEGNKETEINPSGPNIDEAKLGELAMKLMDLKYNDTLIISGSILPNLQPNVYNRLINAVHPNVTVIIDASGKELLHSLKTKPFLVKPNFKELEDLCGLKIKDDETLMKALKSVHNAGAQNVLVSMGKKGAMLYTSEGKLYIAKSKDEEVINTVGSGDCLLAGFVAAYQKTQDFRRALLTGVACGSAKAYCRDIPTLIKVRETMMNTTIREIKTMD